MVRLVAIFLSALFMGGLVYVFGPVVLVLLPLIVVAILFVETQSRQQTREKPQESEASTTSTKR